MLSSLLFKCPKFLSAMQSHDRETMIEFTIAVSCPFLCQIRIPGGVEGVSNRMGGMVYIIRLHQLRKFYLSMYGRKHEVIASSLIISLDISYFIS